jgi:hypothetical protein
MKQFEGDPIKPQVDKLMEAIKPKSGDVYLHQDIAHIAGVEYGTARYRTLIAAYKKRLFLEQNIDIDAVIGSGYRILDENERVDAGHKDFSQSVRNMGRATNRMQKAVTADLDDVHRRKQDHGVRLAQAVVQSGRSAQKQIAIAGRIVLLPRKKA